MSASAGSRSAARWCSATSWTAGIRRLSTASPDEATVFDIGATYTIDAVTVGVGFSRGEYEDANDGEDDQLDHIQLGVGYALGEGVNLGAMVGWFDYEDEGPDDNDNTGWQTGVGINMGF
jgi:predicted porin